MYDLWWVAVSAVVVGLGVIVALQALRIGSLLRELELLQGDLADRWRKDSAKREPRDMWSAPLEDE